MIPAVELHDFYALIPILGENEKKLKLNIPFEYESIWCSLRSNICFDEGWRDFEESETISQILMVYDVQCTKTFVKYFLVSFCRINETDDIINCVALPYNQLNIIKFYKEYVMTFEDKPYDWHQQNGLG